MALRIRAQNGGPNHQLTWRGSARQPPPAKRRSRGFDEAGAGKLRTAGREATLRIGSRPRRARSEAKPVRTAERAAPPGGVSSAAAIAPPSGESRSVPIGKRTRYVAVAVRREANHRDQGRCAFVSAERRRCDVRAFLEFDHVEPFARFGAADARNIRLLCRAHNWLHARNSFGALHVAAKIAASKRRSWAVETKRGPEAFSVHLVSALRQRSRLAVRTEMCPPGTY